MPTGHIYPPERRIFADPRTGVEVAQLTAYPGNSHHLYFTEYGWYDDESKLLFSGERDGAVNLFSLDLTDYRIPQLTALVPLPLPRAPRRCACRDARRPHRPTP